MFGRSMFFRLSRALPSILAWTCTTIAAPANAAEDSPLSWVVLGVDGQAVARTLTTSAACPVITIDGASLKMRVRAPAGTEPLRRTRSGSALSKPSEFPVLTCEADLPLSTRQASIGGHDLALIRPQAQRIVVIGDTGCRLKAADNAWQACNDPAAYPFARIAAAAAAWKPDLVIHVGDYLYRENPCPEGSSGCAGSPWGYGWDAWNADFFAPARPLLEAAPWVMIRGNHENCDRGGQGWWRFLDPRRLEPGRDCNDPANDALGDYQTAYKVPLGGGAQLVAMDIATSGEKPLAPEDARFGQLVALRNMLDIPGDADAFTIVAGHYPILGLAAHGKGDAGKIKGESAGVQSAFSNRGRPILPASVDMILSGHVHLWEQVSFAGDYPSQFIAGFSGTQEDVGMLPKDLPTGTAPLAGVNPANFASWTKGFGWMSMERRGEGQWEVEVHSAEGAIVQRCHVDHRVSRCE